MSTSEPDVDNCLISTDSSTIRTQCAFSSRNYQVIAHLSTDSDLNKLYINRSMSPENPVTIAVESDGEYLVFLFAIGEGIGILDSIPYRKVVLQVLSNTTIAAPTTGDQTLIIVCKLLQK